MLEYLQFKNRTENKGQMDKSAFCGKRKRQSLALWAELLILMTLALGACGQAGELDGESEGGKDMGQEGENTQTNVQIQVQGEVQKEDVLLHYILPEGYEFRYIGDVHPFYDAKSQKWLLYYLDTSGQFHSKLLTSGNGIDWEPVELTFRSSMANYGVLGIVQAEGRYYSYYGD